MINDISLKNLKSSNTWTEEQKKAYGSKGGLIAAENRKRKKLLKEIVQMVLEQRPDKYVADTIVKIFPDIPKAEITNKLALISVVYQKALNGDMKAFEILRDTGGEKPGEKMDISNSDGSLSPKRLEVVFKKIKDDE